MGNIIKRLFKVIIYVLFWPVWLVVAMIAITGAFCEAPITSIGNLIFLTGRYVIKGKKFTVWTKEPQDSLIVKYADIMISRVYGYIHIEETPNGDKAGIKE
jgi:hypothetical protein